MNRIQLYIINLKNEKISTEFEMQELINSNVLFDEFTNKMDELLLRSYHIDMKINLLCEYLKPESNDNI